MMYDMIRARLVNALPSRLSSSSVPAEVHEYSTVPLIKQQIETYLDFDPVSLRSRKTCSSNLSITDARRRSLVKKARPLLTGLRSRSVLTAASGGFVLASLKLAVARD
jgi:hypothetical protein